MTGRVRLYSEDTPLLVGTFEARPVQVQAVQVPGPDEFESQGEHDAYLSAIAEWCDGGFYALPGGHGTVEVDAVEGYIAVEHGSFVIRLESSLYSVLSEEDFENTYRDVSVPGVGQQSLL